MKEYVQKPGIRPWHGDELVALQGEPFEAIHRFFKPFGPFILDGVEASGPGPYVYSPGTVGMEYANEGYKIARFPGVTNTSDNGLIYLQKTVTQKLYDDGNNNDAVYDYTAVYLDEGDLSYYTVDASLLPAQKLYVWANVPGLRNDFDTAFRKRALQPFVIEPSLLQSTPWLGGATVETRICRATGQVFLRGSVRVANPQNFNTAAKWLPVKALSTLAGYMPPSEVLFTAQARYGITPGDYFLESTAKDYVKSVTMGVDPSGGRLMIGAVSPSMISPFYTVYFNTSYFYI